MIATHLLLLLFALVLLVRLTLVKKAHSFAVEEMSGV